jgi:hypothetical protein
MTGNMGDDKLDGKGDFMILEIDEFTSICAINFICYLLIFIFISWMRSDFLNDRNRMHQENTEIKNLLIDIKREINNLKK